MNTKLWVRMIIGLVLVELIGLPAHARIEGKTEKVDSGDIKGVVQKCLATVKDNIGGWCGTPNVTAYHRLTQIGAPVVPHLISALKRSQPPEVDRFIIQVVSSITCRHFETSQPRKSLIRDIEVWWKANGSRRREDWILDGMRSSDEKDIALALHSLEHIKDKAYVPKLVSLLKSPNPKVATGAVYALWDNFKSQEALDYVKGALSGGTSVQKRTALSFIQNKKTLALSPLVVKVLRSEQDYGVLAKAANVARALTIKEAVPALEVMDRDKGTKYPKVQIIRALATLKGAAYREHLLKYLKDGSPGERMAAADVLDRAIDPEGAVEPLLSALKDADINVQRYACLTLGRVAAEDVSVEKLEKVVPALIDLLRQEGEFDVANLADRSLWKIAEKHFSGRPKVDESLGGSKFARHALPIWEKWWEQKKGRSGKRR